MSFNTLSNDLSISSQSKKQQLKENQQSNEEINEDSNEDTTFEPLMSRKIIKLIADKYNIPMDNNELNKILKTLEKHERKYQKIDKTTLKQLRIKQDKLSSFGILDINKEIKNALCNDNYGADNLKSLDDIELFTDYVDTTSYNTPEYQLITLLKWCVIYADFDSYMVGKTNYKSTPNFKFNSTELKEIIQEIKDLGDTIYKKVNILAYDFSGGHIKLDKGEFNMNINWCNRFIENRFAKIINPTYPNSNQYKCWCRFLNKPIKISSHNKKFKKLQQSNIQTDIYYCKFLYELYNYHKNIANFIPNPVIMPHPKCSERSSAFMQSLLSYQYNKPRDIKNIMDENHEDYYMTNDISDRLTCFYKLLSFDLDVNKNTFELPKLKQDLTFIIDYLLKPIDNIKIYYTIDFNKIINVDTVLKELDSLIANDSNKTHEHQYRYWVLDQGKDVSIHIYVSGVMFTDMQLFGLSKIIHQAVNNYYLFYIDHSTYKAGQQQFRCPYSGKMAGKKECRRMPVIRTKEDYTKEDLIEFYQYCTVYPTKNDKYCNKFECFMEHCNDECRKQGTTHNATPVSLFKAQNKKTVRVVKNIETLYNIHPVEFDKPTQLLIDMQIETVQKIYGYPEHRPARLTLLHNIIALGGNMANILEVNAKLGINHTNGTHTENLQNKEDCNWIISQYNKTKTKDKINGQKAYLYYNDKLLYKNNKPIIFPMTMEIKKILFETPLTCDIAKYLARHYYAFVDSKHVYYLDTQFNQTTSEAEVLLRGPYSDASQMTTDKFNIYTENGMISINPYNYFASPNIKMYRFATVGFSNNIDCFNTYPLEIPEEKKHKSFDELFKTYPNFYKLLFRVFDHSALENKEEVNNRINYFLTSICYALQYPFAIKSKALLISTENGAGKTQVMEILKDCFKKLVLTNKRLNSILSDQFNDYMLDKVIVCCEELKINQDYDVLKEWITAGDYYINPKGKKGFYVPNTSIKIFYSNNKHFNFIRDTDRRIVIFRSNIIYPKTIDADIAKLFNKSEYRTNFINYLRDYLINYNADNFDPEDFDLIPQSCQDQYDKICKNNEAYENNELGLIKQIFQFCVSPRFIKGSTKAMTLKHILEMINFIIAQTHNYHDYNDFCYEKLSEAEKELFIDKDSYIKLCGFVSSSYDLRTTKNWIGKDVTKALANAQGFDDARVSRNLLNLNEIPDNIKQTYYTSKQISVIEYNIKV